MPIDTYDNLKSELADWLDDDGLETQIETFIDLAEARHRRELRVRQMMFRYSTTLAAGERYLALPANFVAPRKLRLFDGTTLHSVAETSDAGIEEHYTTSPDTPQWFTCDDEIEFERPADKSYTAELKFFGWVDALSDANTTNGILTRAPDAYLWAALAASAPWLQEDPRLQTWEAAWVSVRDALNDTDREKGGGLVSRVRRASVV